MSREGRGLRDVTTQELRWQHNNGINWNWGDSVTMASGASVNDAIVAPDKQQYVALCYEEHALLSHTNRNVLQLEKRLRSNETAAKHIKDVQLQESLAALRQKAANLWTDQWMYDEPTI
ncbi:hypothetical protein ATCC90586_004113 [Pythium insidiosum]|nr:hypothetical protein ATCC90586_004113 [Pythium insidiosum]